MSSTTSGSLVRRTSSGTWRKSRKTQARFGPPRGDLPVDGARDDVARCEFEHPGGVPFHEPLARAVAQVHALTPRGFGEEDAHPVNSCGVELRSEEHTSELQ